MPNIILDVDESIIKNSLLLPETKKDDQDLEKLMKTLDGSQIPSVTFRPIPGICIKTKTDNNEKIFINICQTTEIPPPDDITDEKFSSLLEDECPRWCIPMSIGHERFEEDKSGSKCLTYDIAINSKFFEKIQAKKPFFAFTVLTMMSAIEEKHDRVLDSTNYVILKNRKVMGKLHDHRVEKREMKRPTAPKPLIEEISDIKSTQKKQKVENRLRAPVEDSEYVILRKPKIGNVEKLIGFFKLPNQCNWKDVKADVGQDRIVVEVLGSEFFVDVFVPFSIDQQSVIANLDQNLNVLRLDMPVLSA